MTTATIPRYDGRTASLKALDDRLREWDRELIERFSDIQETPPTDAAHSQYAQETITRLLQIDSELQEADLDPRLVARLRGGLLDGVRAAQHKEPLAALEALLLDVGGMRQLLEIEVLEWYVPGLEDDVAAVLEQLGQWLPQTTQAELAALMGVSTRQYQRWSHMHTPPVRRAQLVAQLIAVLRRSWTNAGVVAWFYRPRYELDDREPIDLLDDPAYERRLIGAVAGEQGGT